MAKVRVRRKRRKPIKPEMRGQVGLLTDKIATTVQNQKKEV